MHSHFKWNSNWRINFLTTITTKKNKQFFFARLRVDHVLIQFYFSREKKIISHFIQKFKFFFWKRHFLCYLTRAELSKLEVLYFEVKLQRLQQWSITVFTKSVTFEAVMVYFVGQFLFFFLYLFLCFFFLLLGNFL